MSKLNPTQTRRALTQAVEEYGNRCHICNRTDRPLEVDHLNGDPEYNPSDGSNWAPACGRCNKAKGPRRGPGKRSKKAASSILPGGDKNLVSPNTLRESEREGEREGVRMMSGEMVKNMECEPKFRKYVYKIVREFGGVVYKELKVAGAEYAGVSAQTADRYLEKMCSFAGSMEIFRNQDGEKCVRLRAQATPPESQVVPHPERKIPTNGEKHRLSEAAKKEL